MSVFMYRFIVLYVCIYVFVYRFIVLYVCIYVFVYRFIVLYVCIYVFVYRFIVLYVCIYVAPWSCEARHLVPLYIHTCSGMTIKLNLNLT